MEMRRNIMNQDKGKRAEVEYFGKGSGYHSSFVSCISEPGSFGTIRLAKKFQDMFGEKIPSDVNIVCKECYWWGGKYKYEEQKIVGLDEFFKHHKVKQRSILILEYIVKGRFDVTVYKPCGVEKDYIYVQPRQCISDISGIEFKEAEYVPGIYDIESEKALSLLYLNGLMDGLDYFHMPIDDYEISKDREDLILRNDMFQLYKDWNDGDVICFSLIKKNWKIKIKKQGDTCILGPSWFKFIEESGIEKGDLLILQSTEKIEEMKVCIFKEEDLKFMEILEDKKLRKGSFFQFVHSTSLQHKEIAPPPLVHKYYYPLLKKLRHVHCGGHAFPVNYHNDIKVLGGFGDIFLKFHIGTFDTMFLSLRIDGEAFLRIFRKDGMEVDYVNNGVEENINSAYFYLSEEWLQNERRGNTIETVQLECDDTGSADNAVEAVNLNGEAKFTQSLTKSHVDLRSHGVYVSRDLGAKIDDWDNETKVVLRKDELEWNVGINLKNGRKRFCSGWNKFVRENELQNGDTVIFNLLDDGNTFDIQIKKKANKKSGNK